LLSLPLKTSGSAGTGLLGCVRLPGQQQLLVGSSTAPFASQPAPAVEEGQEAGDGDAGQLIDEDLKLMQGNAEVSLTGL